MPPSSFWNPLAALRNGLAVLDEADGGDVGGRPVLAMTGRQLVHLVHLVHLVDDLLDLSRVTRGDIELKHGAVDVARVLEAAIELVRPAIEARGHRLLVERADSPLPVQGDFERLVQVVSNLLANAAKYSDEQGEIRVSMGSEEGFAVVMIRDRGFGIPPEQLPTRQPEPDEAADRAEGLTPPGSDLARRFRRAAGSAVLGRRRRRRGLWAGAGDIACPP